MVSGGIPVFVIGVDDGDKVKLFKHNIVFKQLYFIPIIHPNDKHRDPTTDHSLGISSKRPGSSPLHCINYRAACLFPFRPNFEKRARLKELTIPLFSGKCSHLRKAWEL